MLLTFQALPGMHRVNREFMLNLSGVNQSNLTTGLLLAGIDLELLLGDGASRKVKDDVRFLKKACVAWRARHGEIGLKICRALSSHGLRRSVRSD